MKTRSTSLKQPSSRIQCNANSHPYLAVEMDAYRELLRQARQTFNVHLVTITVSVGVSLTGCFLMASGKAMEGTVSAVTGSGAAAYLCQVARISNRESSKKLEKLVKEVKVLRQPPNSNFSSSR
jgi:hypothetical protein